MKKSGFILATLLFFSGMSHAEDHQWTLQECLDYALAHNISLQKKKLAVKSATEDVKGAKAALLPSLSISTNQNMGYKPWRDAGTISISNGSVDTKVNKTYYNGTYSLGASWTVWDGKKNINTVKLDHMLEQQAALDSAVTANSIQEKIAQLFVQILYLNEAVKVSEQALETSTKNVERGQKMVEVGKLSKADVAQLTAQMESDRYNIVSSQSQLANYKLQLKQVLEITDDSPFDIAIPQTTAVMAMQPIPSLTAVYQEALLKRPEIEKSKLAIQSSDLNIKIAKAGWKPSVSLSASAGTGTSTQTDNAWGTQLKTNFDLAAGVTIRVPILDNRKTKTAVNKARISQENAILDLQEQQKTLYATIEKYWLDATTNQNKYTAALATEASEQQSYDLLSEQFHLGLKNIIELMTGKDKLMAAQLNTLQSKYLTILNIELLKFYQGESAIKGK